MSFQKHCPGCFHDKAGEAVCPVCGYDEAAPRSPVYLPHGIIIGGQYRVGRVLGRPGGFGITYLGWDINLQQRVAIKEFLPREIATRHGGVLDISVHVPEDRPSFDFGKEQFLREARIVARFDHPNIVRVRNYFNANGTAYLVMDYYEGTSLGDYLSHVRSVIEPALAVPLIRPVLEGLHYVHEREVLHRDLKPHNIYLATIGKPIILDFGAARQAAGDRAHSLSVVYTEGYAPLEQYQRRANQGPWTDVYGAAATLYRMITGQAPPIALDRLGFDPIEVSGWAGLPDALRPALSKALAVRPEARFQSAAEFLEALAHYREVYIPPVASEAAPAPPQEAPRPAAASAPPASPPPVDDQAPTRETVRPVSRVVSRPTPTSTPTVSWDQPISTQPETDHPPAAHVPAVAAPEPVSVTAAAAPVADAADPGVSSADPFALNSSKGVETAANPSSPAAEPRRPPVAAAAPPPATPAVPPPPPPTRNTTRPAAIVQRDMPLTPSAEPPGDDAASAPPLSPKAAPVRQRFVLAVPAVFLVALALLALVLWPGSKRERSSGTTPDPEAAPPAVLVAPAPAASVPVRTAAVGAADPASQPLDLPLVTSIAGGEARIGDLAGDGAAGERPAQSLRLAPFKLAMTETTVAQFEQFVQRTRYDNPMWRNYPCESAGGRFPTWQEPGYSQGPQHPVVCVSAADAQAYADWLTRETGRRFRLPTEAEWEYAARGGTRTRYWWGDGVEADKASCADCPDRRTSPKAVRSGPPNPFGLFDTAANVREWTCSAFVPYGNGDALRCAPVGSSAPLAVRGGSWQEPAEAMRASHRAGLQAHRRDVWTGFRLVLDSSPAAD